MNKFFIIALFIVSTQAISKFALIREEWNTFKLKYHKKYESPEEEKSRLKIFMYNRNKIVKHNAKYSEGQASFKMSVNEYADELHTVFKGRNGLKIGHILNFTKIGRPEGLRFLHPVNVKLDDFVDWRKAGAVTAVKNQGTCGSCWAFSAVGSLEAQHFRRTGVLISLSEQNLLDCTRSYGNHGCEGGFVDLAFEYIKENHGIDTEKSYPYEGEEKSCNFNPKTVGTDEAGFVDIPHGDEEALKAAVATVGPVSIVIDASHESLMFYSEGIYDEPQCSPEVQDHAVLIIGYGSENGKDYWLVKNSWGESWGNKGYIKMSRNKNNQCGVATTASYPLVK